MIDRLFMLMLIPHDKSLHALYGLFVYSLIALYNPLLAIIAVAIQSVGKEVYDLYHRENHTPDAMDAVYTFIPAFIIYLLGLI